MSEGTAARRAGRRIAPSLVLLTTAGVFAVLGRAPLALTAAAIAVVGQQLAWLYPVRARRAATAVGAGFDRFVHGLSTALFTALHLLVVLPAWVLVGRDAFSSRPVWHEIDHHPTEPHQLGSAGRTRTDGRRPALDALAGLTIVAVAVIGVELAPASDPPPGQLVDRPTATAELPAALSSQPDAATVLAEQGAAFGNRVPDDELGWVLGTSEGTLVNVRDGERVTATEVDDDHPLEVWFFGGSVAWGLGQSDGATIPARFAALAAEQGHAVRARNFAVPAYLVNQSAKLLERELARQPTAPDLIVFLDGYNEMYGGMASTIAGVAPGDPFTAYRATGSAGLDQTYRGPVASLEDRYRGVLDMHARGRTAARRAAGGIEVAFAWQPNAHSGSLRPGEWETLRELGWSRSELEALRTADAEIRRRLPDAMIDLGDVFDSVDTPIYLDTVHVNEEGADLLARALLDDLDGTLDLSKGQR